jgi:hypothetical protein
VRYVLVVVAVVLAQVAITWAIIAATAGGGSFVGLGAMLMAVLGIPSTALVLALLIHAYRTRPMSSWILRVVLIALGLPAAQCALMVLVSVFRL